MFGVSKYKIQQKQGFRYIQTNGGSSKTKKLVLLHGMFGQLSNYDPLINQLGEVPIVVPEIPLYDGCSSQLTIRQLTKWFHSFLDQMNIEQPILLGNSMGGHVALDYTLQYPENVDSLILTGSSGIQEKNFGYTFPRRKDRDFIRKKAAITFYDDLVNEQIVDHIMDVVSSPSKMLNLLAIARDTHEYNVEKYLPDIPHPTLLIWGRNDEITPPSVAHRFYEQLPNASLRWIDKCGHAPMMEHPQKFASYLNDFLINQQYNSKQKISSHEKNYSYF